MHVRIQLALHDHIIKCKQYSKPLTMQNETQVPLQEYNSTTTTNKCNNGSGEYTTMAYTTARGLGVIAIPHAGEDQKEACKYTVQSMGFNTRSCAHVEETTASSILYSLC